MIKLKFFVPSRDRVSCLFSDPIIEDEFTNGGLRCAFLREIRGIIIDLNEHVAAACSTNQRESVFEVSALGCVVPIDEFESVIWGGVRTVVFDGVKVKPSRWVAGTVGKK